MLTQSNDVSTIFKKMEQILERNRVGNSTAVPSRDCDIRGVGKGPFLCREVINFVMILFILMKLLLSSGEGVGGQPQFFSLNTSDFRTVKPSFSEASSLAMK